MNFIKNIKYELAGIYITNHCNESSNYKITLLDNFHIDFCLLNN